MITEDCKTVIKQNNRPTHDNLNNYRIFRAKARRTIKESKSRKENPQKPTQLSSRSHPRHLVGKRTAQKTPS